MEHDARIQAGIGNGPFDLRSHRGCDLRRNGLVERHLIVYGDRSTPKLAPNFAALPDGLASWSC
jgi:hypothetical protein